MLLKYYLKCLYLNLCGRFKGEDRLDRKWRWERCRSDYETDQKQKRFESMTETQRNEYNQRIEKLFEDLKGAYSSASIGKMGGEVPEDEITSQFGGRAWGQPGEKLPEYMMENMFCLFQLRIDELPYVPKGLEDIAYVVVFMEKEWEDNLGYLDEPSPGNRWEIREYRYLDELEVLPESDQPDSKEYVKNQRIYWELAKDDAPAWVYGEETIDESVLEEFDNDELNDRYYEMYERYRLTKVGGAPSLEQGNHYTPDYVFQIMHNEEIGINWVDAGVAYFYRNSSGQWEMRVSYG